MSPQEQASLQDLCKRQRCDEVWGLARAAGLDWCANLASYLQRQNATLSEPASWRRCLRIFELFPVSRGAVLRLEGEEHPAEATNYEMEAGPSALEPAQDSVDAPVLSPQLDWIDQSVSWHRLVASQQVVLGETFQGSWVFSPAGSHFWRGFKIARQAFAGDLPVLRCSAGAVILEANGRGILTLYAGPNSSVRVLDGELYAVGFESLGRGRIAMSAVTAGPARRLGELNAEDLRLLERASRLGVPLSDLFSLLLEFRRT